MIYPAAATKTVEKTSIKNSISFKLRKSINGTIKVYPNQVLC